jgi:membrane-bound metal-dependent hydrolase YbcI (DUF457 family)
MGALAVGWTLSRPASSAQGLVRQAAIFGALGMAPDLDLLIGRHSQETHSVGAALIVASVAAWRRWPIAGSAIRIWIAALAAWFSHPLFDALSFDKGPPLGVMMFWPFSSGYFHTGLAVFDAIERNWNRPHFFERNILAFLRELLILVPLVWVIWLIRRPRTSGQ